MKKWPPSHANSGMTYRKPIITIYNYKNIDKRWGKPDQQISPFWLGSWSCGRWSSRAPGPCSTWRRRWTAAPPRRPRRTREQCWRWPGSPGCRTCTQWCRVLAENFHFYPSSFIKMQQNIHRISRFGLLGQNTNPN